MPDTTHPYLSLTPDVVMDALASVGLFWAWFKIG